MHYSHKGPALVRPEIPISDCFWYKLFEMYVSSKTKLDHFPDLRLKKGGPRTVHTIGPFSEAFPDSPMCITIEKWYADFDLRNFATFESLITRTYT